MQHFLWMLMITKALGDHDPSYDNDDAIADEDDNDEAACLE